MSVIKFFRLSNFYFLLLFFFFISNSSGQELVTDRPDQTESAVSVPLNSLQLETGILYENDLDVDNYSIAGTLIRYGLFEKIELRVGAAYLVSKTEEITNSGITDLLFGAKINFLTEEESLVDFGLLIHAALPVGAEAFKPVNTEPELIASISKSLSEKFSLSVNLGGSHDSSIEEIVYLYTIALGYSLTDNFGVFAEVFGNLYSSFKPDNLFDAGLTYLLSDNVQLDLSGGKRLNNNNSFWFIGTGISFRLNNI